MHTSLTRQSVSWEALIALDGASPDRLPAPLAQDRRVRILALPRPVGADCARNPALVHVRTPLAAKARGGVQQYGRSLRAVVGRGEDLVHG